MSEITVAGAIPFLESIVGALLPAELAAFCIHNVINKLDFKVCPGARSHHHNYEGGLAQHTAEVVSNCVEMMGELPRINVSVLLVAAVFHDFCKTREYAFSETETVKVVDDSYPVPAGGEPMMKRVPAIERLPYQELIGHPVGSALYFQECLWADGLGEQHMDLEERVIHAILAHHGRRDWGAPIEPKTFEAWMLHAADMLSAQPLAGAGHHTQK